MPERVVALVADAVAKSSQVAVANAVGLSRLTIQRCSKGIGEPSQATLEKLAAHFGKTVGWLRGDGITGENGGLDFNLVEPSGRGTMKGYCAVCGGEVMVSFNRGPDGNQRLAIIIEPCPACSHVQTIYQ